MLREFIFCCEEGLKIYIYVRVHTLVCSVVEYANHDDMKNALRKLDGVELKGRKLRLIEDSKGSKKKYVEKHMCFFRLKSNFSAGTLGPVQGPDLDHEARVVLQKDLAQRNLLETKV